MIGQLNCYDFYYIHFNILLTCIMTIATLQLSSNIITWHYQFAHLNQTSLKHLPNITLDMKILFKPAYLLLCMVCIESKMTRQPQRNIHTSSNILGYCIHVDMRRNTSIYVTWKRYWYIILFTDDVICITWVRFMKKKSDVLSVFYEFMIIL